MHNSVQVYTTLHNCTKLFLDNTWPLFTTSQNSTKNNTTLQHFTKLIKLNTTSHNSTKLYTIFYNLNKLYTTLHNSTKLYINLQTEIENKNLYNNCTNPYHNFYQQLYNNATKQKRVQKLGPTFQTFKEYTK